MVPSTCAQTSACSRTVFLRLSAFLMAAFSTSFNFRLYTWLSLPSTSDMTAIFHAAHFAALHSSAKRVVHVDGEHPADVLIARRLPTHPMHPCRHAARVQACSTCAPTHRTTIDECSNSQQSVDVLFSQKFATASGNDLMMKSWFSEFSRRVRVKDGMLPCTCMLPK